MALQLGYTLTSPAGEAAGPSTRAPASAGSALTQGRLRSAIGSYSGFCLPPPELR